MTIAGGVVGLILQVFNRLYEPAHIPNTVILKVADLKKTALPNPRSRKRLIGGGWMQSTSEPECAQRYVEKQEKQLKSLIDELGFKAR